MGMDESILVGIAEVFDESIIASLARDQAATKVGRLSVLMIVG